MIYGRLEQLPSEGRCPRHGGLLGDVVGEGRSERMIRAVGERRGSGGTDEWSGRARRRGEFVEVDFERAPVVLVPGKKMRLLASVMLALLSQPGAWREGAGEEEGARKEMQIRKQKIESRHGAMTAQWRTSETSGLGSHGVCPGHA